MPSATNADAAPPVLITGACGFIGSHLAQAFLRAGRAVVGVDNFDPYYPRAAKDRHLAALHAAGAGRFTFAEADIRSGEAMERVFAAAKPEGVVHLAARAGVRPSIEQPVLYADVNVTGTAVMLRAAHAAGCRRIVVASSSSVYGNCPTAPFREDMDVGQPISPYAATKRACELIGYTHWHLTGMPTAMLRFFTVFGPRQRPDLAISLFLQAAAEGRPIQAFGSLDSSRDYTFVDDTVAGIMAAYRRIDAHGFRIWNLGHNHPVTLRDLIATVERVTGVKAAVQEKPARAGDVDRTWADLTRAAAELDYRPSTPFAEGVARQWAAIKALGAA